MAFKISTWLLYSLSLTPLLVWKRLFYYYPTTEAFFIMGIVEMMALCFVWAAYKDPQVRPKLGLVGKAFLAFVAILVLSSAFGVDPTFSFWSSFDRLTGVVFWFHLLAMFIVGSGILRTPEDWRRLFICSTLVGLFVSMLHLLSFTGLDGVWLIRHSATIGNSSFFGVYLLFQIFFSFLLLLQATGKIKIYAVIAISVFFVALLTSEAQAVIWSFGGSWILLGALMFIVKGKRGSIGRNFGWSIMALLVIFFFSASFLLFQPDSWVREAFTHYASGARFAAWEIAWDGIKERPILGWGPENYSSVFFKYYDPCFGSDACGFEMWFDRAHNKILDVWVESGAVGLAAYIAIFFLALWGVWKGVTTHRVNGAVASIVTCALAAYLVQSLVNPDVPVTLLFWAITLLYVDVVAFPERTKPHIVRSIHPFIPTLATVMLLIASFFSILQPLRGNLAIQDWFFATSSQERLEAYDRATRISQVGVDVRRWYLARQLVGGMWIDDAKRQPPSQSAMTELELAAERLRMTLDKSPNPFFSFLQLGLVYHTQAKFFDSTKFQDAEAVLQKAIEFNPRNPQPLWALAAVSLEQNKIHEAVALTQTALDLDPDVLDSHLQRLIAVKFTGDEATFIEYAKEALALSANLEDQIRLIYNADLQEKRTQLIFELY